jgi:hypothetical protein
MKHLGACRRLCFQLGQYLDRAKNRKDHQAPTDVYETRYPHYAETWDGTEPIVESMALFVFKAIRDRRSLYFASSREASGIFISSDENDADIAEGSSVFTSWSLSHHVSLAVKVAETDLEPKLPLITMTSWINGLAFYHGAAPQETVVRWPDAWKQREVGS